MGCFGGGKQPDYNPPNIQLPTAADLYGQARDFGNANMPLAMGAREGALGDLAKGSEYYAGFQPTSMEAALQDKNFQNVWPDTEAYMKNIYGMSGMGSSPVEAAMLGRQYGNMQTSIGQYLTDLGNTRATNSLNSRLGIDPNSFYQPYASTGMNQANNQANLTMGQYNAQYQNALMKYQQDQQKAQAMGGMIGAVGGLALAPFTGGMSMALPLMSMGSQLGTAAGGGTINPMSLAFSGMGAAGNFSNPFASSSGVNFANNMMNSGVSSFGGSGVDLSGGVPSMGSAMSVF